MEIDINEQSFYEYDKPKERTEKRLKEIKDLGMEEVGTASFGVPGIVSGLISKGFGVTQMKNGRIISIG